MPTSLRVLLRNGSDSDQVYAYITGIALQHGGRRCILKADGQGLYFPENPRAICSPLTEDCAILLGPPGNAVETTIPQLAGGRIWFSRGKKLTFLLNPGPALVEPSVLNRSDPNANVDFGFCEFTLDNAQLYANISYVDFVPRLPIAISLRRASGAVQTVGGMDPSGMERIAQGLYEQAQKDGRRWDKLVVKRNGEILRVLSPMHGQGVGASFRGYYEPYVDKVWEHYLERQRRPPGYRGKPLVIDTQSAPGKLAAEFGEDGTVRIGGELFGKPSTADILGCNSGPFATGPSPTRNAIIPRLAAAFARTALLLSDDQPSVPSTFYEQDPTNHYARLVHMHNAESKGYAFAYDDVQRNDSLDMSGKVNAGDPVLFTVTVGGTPAG
ncbi:glycoside hydrolase family 64 protein [Durotheca rogersii]|uniref:glycoside hydrolase family 64 protein n=1 Tax=Durotheca rogersii TaxID=419775 RepID=UPI002220C593|nr:glycoside hydrolase family 64 protein [Durotheca rogersii]KAI5866145.1 glycoside hydrolase family 64 protein [Durotheca rogersii]